MSKTIAIEWDESVARVLVAKVTGNDVHVDRAAIVSLGGTDDVPRSLSEELAQRLHDQKIGRADAVVCISRSGTEMREISVPAAPSTEFPQLVRFQAMRQFASMSDEWLLDYVPLNEAAEGEQVKVLAAAISPQLMKEIAAACEKSHLHLKRVVFRPFSLAALFNQLLPTDRTRICIDIVGDESDMLVMTGKRLAMARTVRLVRDESGAIDPRQTIAEVRRTLMAYGNRTDSSEVSQIVFCGGESELALADATQQELSIETTVFDPFQLLKVQGNAFQECAGAQSGFAALAGSLLDSPAAEATRIDFLNPRKPPEPIAERRRNVLIGAAVGVLALSIAGFIALQFYLKNSKIESLQTQVNAMRPQHETAALRLQDQRMVEDFATGADYNWLEELDHLSEEIPQQGVIVDSVNFQLSSENAASLTMAGRASDSNLIGALETNLRDDRYQVTPRASESIAGERNYPWKFGELIQIGSPFDDTEAAEQTENVSTENDDSDDQDGSTAQGADASTDRDS